MKRALWSLAVLFVFNPSGWAQEKPGPPAEPPQQEQRPTLGSPTEPTLHSGPRTATTNDSRKLARIRTLFIDRIDNSLSDRLIENIGKLGRFRIVPKAKEADAVLSGSCLESRRLKRVHSEVFIADRNGASVWQDNVYRPYNPPALSQAVSETAEIVATHLGESLREANQK
jgi:hypothetical protein